MSVPMRPAPAVVYYGDDFTGATDTLGNAARAGLRALLFLQVPDAAQLERAGPLDCLGIAGAARSMAPAEMTAELAPVADFFRRSGARVLHYKTCSTFDSAPQVGSIGAAVRQLREAVIQPWAAIVGGQPNLGRYCLFGNLFAAAGSGGEVFRLDRHPTMSRHPVTPMHEADLRRHLVPQGLESVRNVPFTAAACGPIPLARTLTEVLVHRPDAVLFDVADDAQLRAIGAVLWARAEATTLLAVGPSSVVQALATQLATAPATPAAIAPAEGPVLVLAGSLSPVTARQVAAARSFETLWLDPAELATRDAAVLDRCARQIADRLAAGRHLLACTNRPVGGAGVAAAASTPIDARALALAGGDLLARVLALVPVTRVGIAGGDTSSLGVQALAAWGLSYLAEVGPGASLCRLHSDVPTLDGVEIMLKGGQMGSVDVFERLVHGTAAVSAEALPAA